MTPKPERKPDDPEQYKRFIEAAKKAEADETERSADKAFKKVISKHSKESRG
jgi:gamma-glutamyltranspeptidase